MKCAVLYRHFDAQGRLLYVGISLNVLRRIIDHSQASWWFPDIARIELEHFPDIGSAHRAEMEAVLAEKPLHNMNYTGQETHEINRNIALQLTDDQIEAAEADYHDLDQTMNTVMMKHRMGQSTLGFLFGMRGDKTKSPWRKMSSLRL